MGIAFGDMAAVGIDALKCDIMIARPRQWLKISRVLEPAKTVVMRP